MPEYRYALIALVAASVALPGVANAATKPATCRLLVDRVGDTGPLGSPSLDITSGDIATGDTTAVGVLRVADLGATRVGDGVWTLRFAVGTGTYAFTLRGGVPSFTRNGVATGSPLVIADTAANEIRWSVARAAVTDLPAKPKGDPIGGLSAETSNGPLTVDAATSTGTYADGAPSCVTAG